MANELIVLVHGSWLDGWCWRPLVTMLAGHGIDSVAPTLTALGERSHLGGERTGLSTHVTDVLQCLEFVDATHVTLVGHSYGGVVAGEVAAFRPDRVKRLVVIDGYIGSAGQSIFQKHPEAEAILMSMVQDDSPGAIQAPTLHFLGIADLPDAQKFAERLRPMPVLTHTEPVTHSADRLMCEKHYLRFTAFPHFEKTALDATEQGWRVEELAAGHMGIVTAVPQVTDYLVRIVKNL